MMTEQAAYLQRWLQLAPTPPPRDSKTYDTFISYRSSDRAWAMALYDAFQLAGWSAFLDQYALVPGSNLTQSLTKGLEASASGVILWSSRTKDSEWCQRERDAMTTLKGENKAFRYIFAKLDYEPLPLFARADLYEDFDGSPEGPGGVRLLRLLCGLRGVPLSPEAVKMAEEVDAAAKKMLLEIAAAKQTRNYTKLQALGLSTSPGALASPGPGLAATQALISLGNLPQAREVLANVRRNFPQSLRAKQLDGLTLRRLGQYEDAIELLEELKAAGHEDPETLGMLGASWDGLYQKSGRKLDLRHSRELYRMAFQRDPKDYYTGINAASKSLFLGELAEAERLAGEVLPLVATANDGNDLWASCTLGEVYLLQRRLEDATRLFQQVIDRHPTMAGDLAGTRKQVRRLCDALGLSADDAAMVDAPFTLLNEEPQP